MTIGSETRIARIEVGHRYGQDDEGLGTQWSVSAIIPDAGDDKQVVTTVGYLRRSHGDIFGRALIHGFLMSDDEDLSSYERGTLEQLIKKVIVEQMYDEARRCLSSQAAFMDAVFDFDLASPKVEIEFLELPDETDIDIPDETDIDVEGEK